MDREKVIKGLNNIGREIVNTIGHREAVPYLRTIDDVLALLKEQEERIKTLEHQLETITKWRANAGAFD